MPYVVKDHFKTGFKLEQRVEISKEIRPGTKHYDPCRTGVVKGYGNPLFTQDGVRIRLDGGRSYYTITINKKYLTKLDPIL